LPVLTTADVTAKLYQGPFVERKTLWPEGQKGVTGTLHYVVWRIELKSGRMAMAQSQREKWI
jgi:hypothetical protein